MQSAKTSKLKKQLSKIKQKELKIRKRIPVLSNTSAYYWPLDLEWPSESTKYLTENLKMWSTRISCSFTASLECV